MLPNPMADVINLNRFRKRKREEERQRQADANALRHGRTKAEEQLDQLQQQQLQASVDGARLEGDEPDGD